MFSVLVSELSVFGASLRECERRQLRTRRRHGALLSEAPRHFGVTLRFRGRPDAQENASHILMRLYEISIDPDCIPIARNSFMDLALLLENVPEAVVNARVCRAKRDRASKLHLCLFMPP